MGKSNDVSQASIQLEFLQVMEGYPSENMADTFFLAFMTLFHLFVSYLSLYYLGPKFI